MRNNGHKIQLTIRLEPDLYQAAKAAERRTQQPLAHIVAEAARRTLLPVEEPTLSQQLQEISNRLLQRLTTLERGLGRELLQVKEFMALWARSYFNHTPAVPEPERTVASLSGRKRFVQLVEALERNMEHGASILNEARGNHAATQSDE